MGSIDFGDAGSYMSLGARRQREHIASEERKRKQAEQAERRSVARTPIPEREPDEGDDAEDYRTAAEDALAHEAERPERKTRGRKPAGEAKTHYLRDFPRELVVAIRQSDNVFLGQGLESADAISLTDLVSSFVAFHLGYDGEGLSERAAEIVGVLRRGDRSIVNTNKRIEHLERQNAEMRKLLEEVAFGNAYMLFDRLGFRKSSAASPGQVDWTEPDFERMREVMASASAEEAKRKRIEEGRPIR